MKKLTLATLIALLLASLSGCSSLQPLAAKGADASDAALEAAKWQTCKAATIGSLERELAGDPNRIAGWMLWCGKSVATPHPVKEGI